MKIVFRLFLLILLLVAVNWVYQVVKKPSELVDLIGISFFKRPSSTWEAYRDDFEEHSTEIMTPEFLAAMAQAESGGNPLATTQWKWRLTTDVTRIYAPASSSVGMFQYTNATFEDAKRFCVHFGKVATRGKWFSPGSCWFNGLYSRLSPSNSIEMTAARLQYYVDRLTAKRGIGLKNKQKMAAVIHLCGLKKARKFRKKNFNFKAIPACGSHNPRNYYRKIAKLRKRFSGF
ncbi:MAG: transglycosylase SLT domain-containing protein [Proteobacteria bacterium]|nr:transglycosylase SLT domain-containing protein [Pseudomonadota bacterium]